MCQMSVAALARRTTMLGIATVHTFTATLTVRPRSYGCAALSSKSDMATIKQTKANLEFLLVKAEVKGVPGEVFRHD